VAEQSASDQRERRVLARGAYCLLALAVLLLGVVIGLGFALSWDKSDLDWAIMDAEYVAATALGVVGVVWLVVCLMHRHRRGALASAAALALAVAILALVRFGDCRRDLFIVTTGRLGGSEDEAPEEPATKTPGNAP